MRYAVIKQGFCAPRSACSRSGAWERQALALGFQGPQGRRLYIMKTPALVTLISLLAACAGHDEFSETAANASMLAMAGSYLGYSQAKEIYQASLIDLELPDSLYAEEVTPDELQKYKERVTAAGDNTALHAFQQQPAFPTFMAYMGSRDGYHFFLYKPYFEPRKILKIRQKNYEIDTIRPLSTSKEDWSWVNPYSDPHFNMLLEGIKGIEFQEGLYILRPGRIPEETRQETSGTDEKK